MKAGFIGLGTLGRAMARRLIVEGVDLTVWNRTEEKALVLGVPIAQTPVELLKGNDIIFLSLFDSKAVEAILFGRDGLLEGDIRGKVIVDMTTNHYNAVGRFYQTVREREGYYLECPVLGSVAPAEQGNLTLLIGGQKEAIDRIVPYVEKLARYIFYFDAEGLANKMKLINNLVLGAFMATIAQAVAYGEAAGLPRSQVLDILAAGAGNSGVLSAKKEKLTREDWTAHFSVALIDKDLRYLHDLVDEVHGSDVLLAAVQDLFGRSMEKYADCDFSAIYNIAKERDRR